MGEKPLLLAPNLASLAYLEAKTQTRRPIKYKDCAGKRRLIPSSAAFVGVRVGRYVFETDTDMYSLKPFCCEGDRLYVREPFYIIAIDERIGTVDLEYYDGFRRTGVSISDEKRMAAYLKRRSATPSRILSYPSIHMPAVFSRTRPLVKNMTVARLTEVTEEDAQAEGYATRASFLRAFLRIYPECCEKSWVWVITFGREGKSDGGQAETFCNRGYLAQAGRGEGCSAAKAYD